MRLPWRPREYEAVVDALHAAEEELAKSQAAHGAEARKTRLLQAEVRQELTKRRRSR